MGVISNLVVRIGGDFSQMSEEMKKAQKEAQKQAKVLEEMGGKFKDAFVGVGLAAGATALAVGGLAVKFTDDLNGALGDIQAQTGYSDESMASMRDTMVDIYNQGFGEDFADIGKSIAEIGKQTGDTGQVLEGLTKTALMMRDTFGFEVNESIRSAKMMMDQFGLSGEDAYNLIAQGAQWGLDKNGDLLDSINEYSVQFSQMGFSAEEMFNMLNNGAMGGTFSVDKLGDAVKEFGIRAKDGSKSTQQAFQSLGLDAGKLSADFAAGGEKGKAAFQQVNDKLIAMKDPLAQNQIGTALWGSMWEDLGVKGISALTQTQGEISSTTNALAGINAVQYNTFGDALQGIRRNLETGILLPLGDMILPKLAEFSQWFMNNMPQIQSTIQGAMQEAGKAFELLGDAIQFVIDNSNILIPVFAGVLGGLVAFKIISTVNALFVALQGIMTAVSVAGGILNAVMALNPFILVAAAIGVLILAGVALYQNWDYVKAKAGELFSTVSNKFNQLKTAITEPIKWAAGVISEQVEKIKGFFNNMGIKLPSIKLPHFSVKRWSINPVDWVANGAPYLTVDWYAKGGVFNGPSIIGVGEAGPEAVIPLDKLDSMINSGGGGNTTVIVELDGYTIAKAVGKPLTDLIRVKTGIRI